MRPRRAHELDDLLNNQAAINELLKQIIDKGTEPWGITVVKVETKDVGLPDEMKRAMARQADERIARGEARPLEGIPLAVKDMFCTKDTRATACSHILDNFVPTYESTVTTQLWRDGAVLLGKTNCDEFAMGSSNETSYFGPVASPWRRRGSNATRWTCGSACATT